MDIVAATRAYDRWLASRVRVVRADVARKHARLAEDPFVFLRGTFYGWMQRWPDAGAAVTGAPRVLAVGDLHLENFGTWRDAEGRLVWGVNDVDEAARLPYTLDLVRLATSALIASRRQKLSTSARDLCAAIIDGYASALAEGGRPFVLADHHGWLRRIATSELRDPEAFWKKLDALKPASGAGVPRDVLAASLPARGLSYRVCRREAGVGSLGRPRFVATAEWNGSRIAREAKALVPSAAVWAAGRATGAPLGRQLLARAVRAHDPFFTPGRAWIVRRLAPDCARIELTDLPHERDEARLLRAMGWDTANLHLGSTTTADVRRHLRRLPAAWLADAAERMADITLADWSAWRAFTTGHDPATA